jgi:D-alanyl-D-alanine carboxypeptidase
MLNSGVMRRRRQWVAFMSAVAAAATVVVATADPAEAARRKRPAGGGYAPPYASIVVDVKTGRVLQAENEDALRHPASITKVMTLYLLFEQIDRGRFRLDSPLTVSSRAAAQAPSKLGMRPGETIEVEDAIKALVTKSANDVAVVVAENIAGSEDGFADMMTRKARALGMSQTVFKNASGLPNTAQVTTARDLSVLARAVQDRFPRYYKYFETRAFNFAGVTHRSHNKLIGRVEGVDGIKTGFTRASGFNLMTNAKTQDRHVVAIVLGGRSGASRDQIVANLVRQNIPRAFAGARSAPMVADLSERTRPAVVAEASRPRGVEVSVETTATTTNARSAPPRPLDLNGLRAVVASADTTTPISGAQAVRAAAPPAVPPPAQTAASNLRWNTGPQPAAGAMALAYAPAEPPSRMPVIAPRGEPDDRTVAVRSVTPPATVAVRTSPATGWVIQLGATDDEGKAKSILADAQSKSGRVLGKAAPFTERVVRDGTTLFRARFSGFSEADAAQEACKALKRNGFACFATRG